MQDCLQDLKNRPSTPHSDKKHWGSAGISSLFRAFALVMAIPVLSLIACTTGQKVSRESDTDIRAEETSTLCGSLAHNASPNAVALDELQRRGEIRAQYVGAIRERRVTIGMNICEVFASIGVPNQLNRVKLPPGTAARLVYSSGHYVYLDEGNFVTIIEGF
jgi:hypothetical protein